MVGEMTVATALYKRYGTGNHDKRLRAPNGFNYIGGGCYRDVWLHKEANTVYKIGNTHSNEYEAENAEKLRRKSTKSLGFNLYIPETDIFRLPIPANLRFDEEPTVIAQEYAADARFTNCAWVDTNWMSEPKKCNCKSWSGLNICIGEVFRIIKEFTDVFDIHCENVLMDKSGTFWLIDMGS